MTTIDWSFESDPAEMVCERRREGRKAEGMGRRRMKGGGRQWAVGLTALLLQVTAAIGAVDLEEGKKLLCEDMDASGPRAILHRVGNISQIGRHNNVVEIFDVHNRHVCAGAKVDATTVLFPTSCTMQKKPKYVRVRKSDQSLSETFVDVKINVTILHENIDIAFVSVVEAMDGPYFLLEQPNCTESSRTLQSCGWFSMTNAAAEKLQHMKMQTFTAKECGEHLEGIIKSVPEWAICATSDPAVKGVIEWDLGSPLFATCNEECEPFSQCEDYLIGLASSKSQRTTTCALPDIYVAIDSARDWIREQSSVQTDTAARNHDLQTNVEQCTEATVEGQRTTSQEFCPAKG